MTEQLFFRAPTWLGQPLYPFGYPLKPDQIIVSASGLSLMDIYLIDSGDISIERVQDIDNILREYILYHLKAPVWDIEGISFQSLEKMSYSELMEMCIDSGLDPF